MKSRILFLAIAGATLISGAAHAADGGTCSPQTVANPLQPTPAYKPYLRQAVCDSAQLEAFYTSCVADTATSQTCSAWEQNAANNSCNACLITQATANEWGPIVAVAQRDLPFNIAGCFGITLNEGSSTTGCGAARWAFDRCLRSACPVANCCADPANCTPAEEQAFTDCRANAFAAGGPCETASTDLNQKCTGLDTEAGQAALNQNCPLGDNVTLHDFTVAITNAFCGSGPATTGDGGTGSPDGSAPKDGGKPGTSPEAGADGGSASSGGGGSSSSGCSVGSGAGESSLAWLLFPVAGLAWGLSRRRARSRSS